MFNKNLSWSVLGSITSSYILYASVYHCIPIYMIQSAKYCRVFLQKSHHRWYALAKGSNYFARNNTIQCDYVCISSVRSEAIFFLKEVVLAPRKNRGLFTYFVANMSTQLGMVRSCFCYRISEMVSLQQHFDTK